MKLYINITPNVNIVLSFLVFAGLLNLPFSTYFENMNLINNYVRIMSVGIIFTMFLFKAMFEKKVKISRMTFLILSLYILFLLSTVINSGDLQDWLGSAVSIATIVLAIDLFSNDIKSMISGLMLVLEACCYGNLFAIIIVPDGLYSNGYYSQNWILGNRNQFSSYLLVALLVAYTYRYFGGIKWRTYGIYVASILSVFLVNSSTQMVGLVVLVTLFVVHRLLDIHIKPYWLLGVNVCTFFLIVIFRFQNLFSFFIVDLLHKDLSFTQRTILWDRVIKVVSKSPLIGYGIHNTFYTRNQLGFAWAYHAHNLILQYALQGGLFAIIMFSVIVILVVKELNKFEEHPIAQGISYTLFVYFIMTLAEVYTSSNFMWIVFGLAHYMSCFVEQSNEVQNNHFWVVRSYKYERKIDS